MPDKFLIVSNNKSVAAHIQRAIANVDRTVLIARDGLEAVDLALDQKPDGIFLSVQLTELDGMEVARALRALVPTVRVPIFFLAQSQAEAREVTDAHLPLTDCLIAPFEPAEARLRANQASGTPREDPPSLSLEPENAWAMTLLDPLTRVYHRRYFLHRLAYEAARSARYGLPLAVIVLNMDNLKEINKEHGIVTGDAVLMEVAEQLRVMTRMSDIVGRSDTQDFVILTPQVDKKGVQLLAERIVRHISEHHFVLEKLDLHVTASAGVAAVAGNDLTENMTLLGRAEAALERAKRAGKNRVEME